MYVLSMRIKHTYTGTPVQEASEDLSKPFNTMTTSLGDDIINTKVECLPNDVLRCSCEVR